MFSAMYPKKSSNVRAIGKGFDILDFLSKGKQSYSPREISGKLKIPQPTIHRILSIFCGLGYATRVPKNSSKKNDQPAS